MSIPSDQHRPPFNPHMVPQQQHHMLHQPQQQSTPNMNYYPPRLQQPQTPRHQLQPHPFANTPPPQQPGIGPQHGGQFAMHPVVCVSLSL